MTIGFMQSMEALLIAIDESPDFGVAMTLALDADLLRAAQEAGAATL